MSALLFQVLALFATAAGPAPAENTLLKELVEKGVAMPDGNLSQKLPGPTMADGLTAAQQAKVLAAVAATAPGGKVNEFLGLESAAPVSLRMTKIVAKNGTDLIRTINVHFVIHGDWDVLTSEKFSEGIFKAGKQNNALTEGKKDDASSNDNMVAKAGYLKAPELAVRRISTRSTPELKEYCFYTTVKLFQQVQLSATRFCMGTKTANSVIVAGKLDPRFAKDKEFPNEWRSIDKGPLGNPILGPAQPYSGSAFYAKVTRLIEPKGAIFVEFHQVLYEPQLWFGAGNENFLPGQLRKAVPFKVKDLRFKLNKASDEFAKKAAAEKK